MFAAPILQIFPMLRTCTIRSSTDQLYGNFDIPKNICGTDAGDFNSK